MFTTIEALTLDGRDLSLDYHISNIKGPVMMKSDDDDDDDVSSSKLYWP